jgi:hypothetical protein
VIGWTTDFAASNVQRLLHANRTKVPTNITEVSMRQFIFAIIGIGIVATLAWPRMALSQGDTYACRAGGYPCVRTTAQRYNACVDLALRRGQNLSKGDRHSFDRFVYDCVRGRVR